jgi:hypothetical protein
LKEHLAANRENYRARAATWRFYLKLPLAEELPEAITGSAPKDSPYPYADFSRAWFSTLKNLTLNKLVTTAIAIKRYELKHGKPPPRLAALVPEFLPALPVDLMDGQTLRYRLYSDGSFTLYSVGANAQDDGGDPDVEQQNGQVKNGSAWMGRDWVWPRVGST